MLHLSPVELALHLEKGLCFNCDEKFSRGHKCTPSLFLFVTEEEEGSHEPDLLTIVSSLDELPPAQINLHALSHGALETLRAIGLIGDHRVHILIDGGSTHNFLQQALISTLGLSPQNMSPLKVTVGIGEELQCH